MPGSLARAETLISGKAPLEPEAALIETDIPARLERLPWGRFHTLIVIALGVTWILDGLEVTLAGAVAGALKESPGLQLSNVEIGIASSFYRAWSALFWLANRPAWAQAPVLVNSWPLSGCDGRDRTVVGCLQLFAVSLPHGGWDRWRVHRDCLHHSRIHPGQISRVDRSRHQWQLLDWWRNWSGGIGCAARSCVDAPGFRLACRLLDRSSAGAGHPVPEGLDS